MRPEKKKSTVSAKFGTASGGPSTGELGSIRADEAYEVPLGPVGTEADHPAAPVALAPDSDPGKNTRPGGPPPRGGATGKDSGGIGGRVAGPGEIGGEDAMTAGGKGGLRGS